MSNMSQLESVLAWIVLCCLYTSVGLFVWRRSYSPQQLQTRQLFRFLDQLERAIKNEAKKKGLSVRCQTDIDRYNNREATRGSLSCGLSEKWWTIDRLARIEVSVYWNPRIQVYHNSTDPRIFENNKRGQKEAIAHIKNLIR